MSGWLILILVLIAIIIVAVAIVLMLRKRRSGGVLIANSAGSKRSRR